MMTPQDVQQFIGRTAVGSRRRGQAMTGADITEEEHEVTLRAASRRGQGNRPGRAGAARKETVTQDQEVSETLRKEQIDDPDVDDNRLGAGR